MTVEEPFADALAALEWAVQGMEARAAGARLKGGVGKVPRPCEVLDVAIHVDRLVKGGRLPRHVAMAMIAAARSGKPPPSTVAAEVAAGLALLGEVLAARGIVMRP